MFSWQDRRVALTGATGFVGHHAALELRRHGATVVALTRPTSNVTRLRAAGIQCEVASLDDVDRLAESLQGCDAVVHAAAAVGFDGHWDHYYRVNVDGSRNLLAAARKAKTPRFLHVSSIAAVGASATGEVLDETAVWNLLPRNNPYVTTKRWAEDLALAAHGSDLNVIVVNPASVVGPDDFTGSEFGTLCKRFWKGRLPFHFRGGNNFVDVRDVACGIRLALERGRGGERYLLAGENRTFGEFFDLLTRCAGRRILHVRLPTAMARVIGLAGDRLARRSKRPYLTSAGAALMGLSFFYDAKKAREELGFETRPLTQTLADAHTFWMTDKSEAA